MPGIQLAEPFPFETRHVPRALSWPGPVEERLPESAPLASETVDDLRRRAAEGLLAERYRDLNNANNQAPGAKRMMIRGIASFDRAVAGLADRYPESARSVFQQLLDSPYPFAHYLALRELVEGGHSDLDAVLVAKLEAFAKSADTVGFFWTCEALAKRGVHEAIPALARYASEESPPGLHGPVGMGYGYPAAKAVAYLAGEVSHPEVKRLLASGNLWLRAGALAGLTEAQAPGIEGLLLGLLGEQQPALIRDHAAVGLSRLTNSRQASRQAVGAGG